MDADGLRTFLAVHHAGGVTRAAPNLFRSQPAVSRRLALLERELGVPLFDRVPGGVTISQAGHALLPFAEAALAALGDAEAAVRAVSSEITGPVTVALVGTLASSELTIALRRFAEHHPGVDVLPRTATSREVSDLVRRGEVMLGLRYADDPIPELCAETLFEERLTVVAAPDHQLAGSRCPSLHALAVQRWITFPDTPGRPEAFSARLRCALDAAGINQARILRADSLTAQKRLVEAGFGIALLPDSATTEERRTGTLSRIDVAHHDIRIPVTVITRRHGYLGTAPHTLLDQLRTTFQAAR